MSDLHDLISLLKTEVEQNDSSYVYYTETTGEIIKLCGSMYEDPQEGESILKVSHELANPILSGEKSTTDFIVIYDISLKQKVLKPKNYQDAYKEASSMCYQLPIIKHSRSGHLACEEIYDGMDVFLFDKDSAYKKYELVWRDNKVYKLLKSNAAGKNFGTKTAQVIVEDVYLSDMPTQELIISGLEHKQEYVGVHIDIWYKELEHLGGQHVWIGNCIYKILEDQPANTEFNPDNAEQVFSGVILNSDENTNLDFIKAIKDGDLYLNNNKLYSASIVKTRLTSEVSTKDVIFKTDSNNLLIWRYKSKSSIKVNTVDNTKKDYHVLDKQFQLVPQNNLKNGDKVLLGTKLYQVRRDKEYDIIVTQDRADKMWHINLNPSTLTYFSMTNHDQDDELYFSITSKHDPNILYRSLKIPISMLAEQLVMPFESDSENKDVSIYTAKYFNSYAHEVIK